MHIKCRKLEYPITFGDIKRLLVPDDKVLWTIKWPDYSPNYFTSSHILDKEWSDPELDDSKFCPKWNALDGKINRRSHLNNYSIIDGYPQNPIGRTGLRGRGILGRWGPNHAADPIVTKWKKIDSRIEVNSKTKKRILQFVCIKRRDCNEWAIPGGMIDPGEIVTSTLKREFMEEALNNLDKHVIDKKLDNFFQNGTEIYKGYVDDPRNTDNSWMETVVYNFHDDNGGIMDYIQLEAGDDAVGVRWIDISKNLELYASHSQFIKMVVDKLEAHW